VTPEERQLLLSQYLDGELDPSTRAAVEERLMDDREWRRELSQMKAVDSATARSARRFHRDEGMSRAVLARICGKKSGAHPMARHKRTAQTLRGQFSALLGNLTRAAALIVFGVGAWYGWQYYQQGQSNHQSSAVAQAESRTPALAAKLAPVTPVPTEPPLSEGVKEIAGKDGTRILVRNGSRIEFLSNRHVVLHGEALFVVAKGSEPFLIDLPGDQRIQVLGTRFDVRASSKESRIRVAEGHVRFASNGQKLDAFGGTEIAPDLTLRSVDPRQLAVDWNTTSANSVLTDLTPAWPQAGGSFTRSGTTPLNGPAALVARPEKFYALPEEGHVFGAAVVDAAGSMFVLQTANSGKNWGLWSLSKRGQELFWREVASGALPVHPVPIVTPEGLVVVADSNGLRAFKTSDMHGEKVWSTLTKAMPKGLCVTPAGLLVGAVGQQLIAWDTRDGQVKWTTPVSADLTGAITITPNGQICAGAVGNLLVVLDKDGAPQRINSWKYQIAQAPVVTDSGELWLQDRDGHVGRMALSSGEVTTAAFKKPVLATPLSSGLFGAGPVLQRFDESVAARPPAPDSIMALAQDGKGQVFAAYNKGVLRLQPSPSGGYKEMEFANIAKGEILPNGIAIAPGRVIVTTTLGVQVFE